MKYLLLLIILFFISCNKSNNLNPEQLRTGTFKTTIKDGNYESIATRNDSLQIEIFNKKKIHFILNGYQTLNIHYLEKVQKTN